MIHISSVEPDWDCDCPKRFWDPSRKLLKAIRDYQRVKNNRVFFAYLIIKTYVIRYGSWSVVSDVYAPQPSNIGVGEKVIGGLTVGEYTVVGANAVVTKDIRSYEIVVGIPAKKIGTNYNDTK